LGIKRMVRWKLPEPVPAREPADVKEAAGATA